jgi:purine nucleosidase
MNRLGASTAQPNSGCFNCSPVCQNCFNLNIREKRKIIIDQDAAGPAGTDQQSILLLIQSPQTEVLGITVVTGDMWLTEEVAHTLRMLELIGRTDIPVVPGAEYPLVRQKEETEQWEQRYGSAWPGWGRGLRDAITRRRIRSNAGR